MLSSAVPQEPSASDLAAIDAEWPLIEAELRVVELECQVALRPYDVVAREQLAAAERHVTALARAYAAPTSAPTSLDAARARRTTTSHPHRARRAA